MTSSSIGRPTPLVTEKYVLELLVFENVQTTLPLSLPVMRCSWPGSLFKAQPGEAVHNGGTVTGMLNVKLLPAPSSRPSLDWRHPAPKKIDLLRRAVGVPLAAESNACRIFSRKNLPPFAGL